MSKNFTICIRKGAAYNEITARDPNTGNSVTVDMNGMKYAERNQLRDTVTGALKPVLAPVKRRKRKVA